VTGKYPRPLTLISIFLVSFSLFYILPPLFLNISIVALFFDVFGSYNARLHGGILRVFGVKASVVSNILYLQSGPGLQYSPYCFGFLTVAGFVILVFAVPSLRLKERFKWIASGSLLLFVINQMRIIFELFVVAVSPLGVSTIDKLLYPLLPGIALFEWYRGLNSRKAGLAFRGSEYAER
jgi:hypothetical protein